MGVCFPSFHFCPLYFLLLWRHSCSSDFSFRRLLYRWSMPCFLCYLCFSCRGCPCLCRCGQCCGYCCRLCRLSHDCRRFRYCGYHCRLRCRRRRLPCYRGYLCRCPCPVRLDDCFCGRYHYFCRTFRCGRCRFLVHLRRCFSLLRVHRFLPRCLVYAPTMLVDPLVPVSGHPALLRPVVCPRLSFFLCFFSLFSSAFQLHSAQCRPPCLSLFYPSLSLGG